MSNAAEILVIILSIFLAIFLLAAIVLTILAIKVTRQIKKVTSTTQNAVDHLNSAAVNLTKFSSPVMIGKALFDQFQKRRK